MDEFIKQFYSTYAPDVEIDDRQVSSVSEIYKGNMLKFAVDFEDSYIKPKGQQFQKDLYQQIYDNQKIVEKHQGEKQERTNISTPEYNYEFTPQDMTAWFDNYKKRTGKSFFEDVQPSNQADILKEYFEDFGFNIKIGRDPSGNLLVTNISHPNAFKEGGDKDMLVISPNDFKNKEKEILEYINKYAPKPGSTEYKNAQEESKLRFKFGTEFEKISQLTSKQQAIIDNMDISFAKKEAPSPMMGSFIPTYKEVQPYKEELEQARNYLRQNDPELMYTDHEPTREDIEKRATSIIKNNAKIEMVRDQQLKYLDGLSKEDQAKVRLAHYELKTSEGKKLATNQDLLAAELKALEDSKDFKFFKDFPNMVHTPPRVGEESVTLKNGMVLKKSDFENYRNTADRVKNKIANLNILQNTIVKQTGLIEGDDEDLLRRDLELSSKFNNLFTAMSVDILYGIPRSITMIPEGLGLFNHEPGIGEFFKEADLAVGGYTNNLREAVRPQLKFKEVNPNNLKEFAVQELANQIPILASIYLSGSAARAAGVSAANTQFATILAQTAGMRRKDFALEEEANPFGEKHSDLYKTLFSVAYGVPEAVFERLTTIPIMNRARHLTGRGKITDIGPNAFKNTRLQAFGFTPIQEAVGEGLTEISQNILEGRPVMENVDHAAVVGLAFGFGFGSYGWSAGYMNSKLVDAEKYKEYAPTAEKYHKVQSEIDNIERLFGSRPIEDTKLKIRIEERYKVLLEQRAVLEGKLKKVIENVENIPLEKDEINEFVRLTGKGFQLRQKIKAINESPIYTEQEKRDMISDLQAEGQVVQAQRDLLRENPGNLFLALDQDNPEKIKFRNKAKELNPEVTNENKIDGIAEKLFYEDRFDKDFNKNFTALKDVEKVDLQKGNTKKDAVEIINKLREKYGKNLDIKSNNKLDGIVANINAGTQNGAYLNLGGKQRIIVVKSNAVNNRRAHTTSHEVGHALVYSKLVRGQMKKNVKLMAESILDYLAKTNPVVYKRVISRSPNHEEVLMTFLEEVSAGSIETRPMQGLFFGFLNHLGIKVSTGKEAQLWWDGMAQRIKDGDLRKSDFKAMTEADLKDLGLRKSLEQTYADGRNTINKKLQKLIGDKKFQAGDRIGRDMGGEILTYAVFEKVFDTFILGNRPNAVDPKKYINDVYTQLFNHMSNFTPIMESGQPNIDSLGRPDIYGWVMGQLGFKALDISKKVYEEGKRIAKQKQLDKAKDLAVTTDKKQYLEDEFGKFNSEIGVTPELEQILSNVIQIVIAKYEKGLKEDLSINKTYPDFIRDINKELTKNYKDIVDWHGSGETYVKFLTKNLPIILRKVRTNYLSKNFPEMVEKVIYKEEEKGYRPYPEWKGKTIAREKKAETGRTSGNQLMRKNWDVIGKMINDKKEFINQEIIDLFVTNQNKREGLAKQLSVEMGNEFISNDLVQYNINQPKFSELTEKKVEKLLESTPIARRLVNNPDIISEGLNESFGSEIMRQQDLGLRSSVEPMRAIQALGYGTGNARRLFDMYFSDFIKVLNATNDVTTAVKKIYGKVLTTKQLKKILPALETLYNENFKYYSEAVVEDDAMNFAEWYAVNLKEFQHKNSVSMYMKKKIGIKNFSFQDASNDLIKANIQRNLLTQFVQLGKKNKPATDAELVQNLKNILDFHVRGNLASAYHIGRYIGVRNDGTLYLKRGKNRIDPKTGKIYTSRIQFFGSRTDVMNHLVNTVPGITKLKWINGAKGRFPKVVGEVNGKKFEYDIKTQMNQSGKVLNYKGDLYGDSKTEAKIAAIELRKYYRFIQSLRDKGKIDDIDVGLAYLNMNSHTETMLRRSANVRYKFIGKWKGALRYEHVIPADYVNLVLLDYHTNKKTKYSQDDINQLFKDYNVALIPVTMDKVLDMFFKNTMPATYKIGDNPLTKRYYHLLHINIKNMYAIEDLSDPNAEPIGEIFTEGQDYGFRNSISEKSHDFVIAMQKSVDLQAIEKGASIIDFDDTLVTSKSVIKYTIPRRLPNGGFNPAVVGWGGMPDTGSLTPAEFAKRHDELAAVGAVFDYSEFNKVIGGKKGPFFNKAQALKERFGNRDIYILTARPADAAPAIHAFLKGVGLDIKLENIIGLENGSPQAKADWIVKMASEGYNNFLFADDQIKNAKAVSKAIDTLDVNGKVYQLRIKHSRETIKPQTLDTILDENNPDSPVTGKRKLTSEEAKYYGKPKPWYKILVDLKSKTNVLFVPPSAEDLRGLWNNHIAGKGKKGEADILWFEETIIRPYARGERAMDTSRLFMIDKLSTLYDIYGKGFKNKLKAKEYSGIFTMQDAVRMYIWDRLGYEIPGSQKDIRVAINKLKKDQNGKTFADKILDEVYNHVNKKYQIEYVKPGTNWKEQGVDADIIASILSSRKTLYKEFVNNKNMVFDKTNMNKIEAIYGTEFRKAMEDMFFRMENGINRSAKDMNNFWIKWLNAGVGNIMFLNVRSALLQITSFTNFIDIIGDNNPASAIARFADFLTFKKDLMMIWNSNFLKARRLRGKTDIAMNEILEGLDSSKDFFWNLSQRLIKLGYKPTQLGDSFAIALGGAPFYRNRYNAYIKQGKKATEAHNRSMRDLRERAEETQQSARADLISRQQASVMGRIFLSFQNVTMQYTRIAKKLLVDLKNKRRVRKTDGTYYNINQSRLLQLGRIGMYVGYQHLIFQGLQQAILAMMAFNDDEEKITTNKKIDYLNGALDAIMRGMGIVGGILSVVKNIAVEVSRGDSYRSQNKILDVSPALKTKYTKAKKIIRGAEKGKLSDVLIETPAFLYGIPTDRTIKLIDQIGYGFDLYGQEYEKYQRIMLLLGWNHYNFYDTKPTGGIVNEIENWDFGGNKDPYAGFTEAQIKRLKKLEKRLEEMENK